MTSRRFDAPASNTPRRRYAPPLRVRAKRTAHRIARLIWLALIMLTNDKTSLANYRRRFRVSAWTFHREVRKLRRTGLYIACFMYGDYRTFFYLEETADE
jgi:hypothetical protein